RAQSVLDRPIGHQARRQSPDRFLPHPRKAAVSPSISGSVPLRTSAPFLAAAELVFSPAVARARSVTVNDRLFVSDLRYLLVRSKWAAGAGRNELLHSRKHLFVSSNHGVDDGPPKFGKLFLGHAQCRLEFVERLLATFFRRKREVVAKLGKHHRLVHFLK